MRRGLFVLLCACALPEDDGKNRCVTDDDCVQGSCVQGVCGARDPLLPCPDSPCTAPDTCLHGLCVEIYRATPDCTVGSADDGCTSDAVCFDDVDLGPQCWRFPPCPSGSCDVGRFGAVCHDGRIPGKDLICLAGMCDDAGDCPSTWRCLRFFSSDPYGQCSSGAGGSFCLGPNDCDSQSCTFYTCT
jgi:hypothetical protein